METYKCLKCNVVKLVEFFGPAPTKLGHNRTCRECCASYMREYYKKKPEKYNKHKGYVKDNDLVYKKQISYRYGMSPEQYNEMLDFQQGLCAICKEVEAMGVDHDHTCCPYKAKGCGNCNRGILCNSCNSLLGFSKDRIDILHSAIEYLEQWNFRKEA